MINDLRSRINDEITHQNEHKKLCVPCADLKFGPFPEDNSHLSMLTRKIVNGIEVCCGNSPNQTSTILAAVSLSFSMPF
jgi:hypothetical protein